MKILIAFLFFSYSFSSLASSFEVYMSSQYCINDGPLIGSQVWDDHFGTWRRTPTDIFDTQEATLQEYLGQSDSATFPRGISNSLFHGFFQNSNVGFLYLMTNFETNTDALNFRTLITENSHDFVFIYMPDCKATFVGRKSTGEVALANHFISNLY